MSRKRISPRFGWIALLSAGALLASTLGAELVFRVGFFSPSSLAPLSPSGSVSATNSVTLTWHAVTGATGYAVRVIDNTDLTLRDPRNNCSGFYLCVNNIRGTSTTLPVIPGHVYGWWVSWITSSGAFSTYTVEAFGVGSAVQPPPALPQAPPAPPTLGRPLVGAIRFDVWQSGGPGGNSKIMALGPKKWRYRLPFFGTEISATQVSLEGNTPAVMDQEIADARAAGLNYWVFGHGLAEGRQSLNLYRTSSQKNDINFALGMGSFIEIRVADAVHLIKTEPTYQKIAGGRPLVYALTWYFDSGLTKAVIDDFRARVIAAGLPSPYIVGQHWNASVAATYADNFGLDAIGAYAVGGGATSTEMPFSALVTATQRSWQNSKNTGKKVVPIVMTGWDPRPEWELPNNPYYSGSAGTYYTKATPHQIASHLKEALDWSAANPTATGDANTILIYAWNEITEGGWLLRSNTNFDPVGNGRLDAIASVLGGTASSPPPSPSPNRTPTSSRNTKHEASIPNRASAK